MDNERKNDDGFTLVEMMAVLVIIGLLMGAAVLALGGVTDRGVKTRVQSDLSTIRQALELYKTDMFDYPPEEFGLQALVELPDAVDAGSRYNGPYLTKLPADPWGNPYVYIYPGEENPFELLTYGRDGEPGGEEEDTDISFWDADTE